MIFYVLYGMLMRGTVRMDRMVLLNLLLLVLRSAQSAVTSRSCGRDGTLRLVQTRSITLGNAGRVEICVGGVWGTVHADSTSPWSEKSAQVACIQLGFNGTLNTIFQNTIPLEDHADASVPIYITNVECKGVERNLTQCSFTNLTSPFIISSGFTHDGDAYVVCQPNRTIRYSDVHVGGVQPGDIRLFGSSVHFSGAVQIYSDEFGWQGICPDSDWTDSDADAICQQLGFVGGDVVTPVRSSAGPGGEPLSRRLYAISCPADFNSDSYTIGMCSARIGASDTSNCARGEGLYAAVNCIGSADTLVRLVGGDDSREGIVEIAYNGRYGMICDEGFSLIDAQIVCNSLNYGRDDARVMRLSSSSPILRSESNVKPIWLTQVACTSSDLTLFHCTRGTNIIGYANCSVANIAAVDCGNPSVSGQTLGIVIVFLVMMIVLVCPFVYVFGRVYWAKRHNYGCYNTLTTPSSWCSGGTTRRRTWQPPRTIPTTAGSSGNAFDLHRQNAESEGEPSSNGLSDPGLSKAPPPSYQAASNYPTHNPSADLPPPYPGRPAVEAAYPPLLQPTTDAAACPPPAAAPLPDVNYQGNPPPSCPPEPNIVTSIAGPDPVSTAVPTASSTDDIAMSVESASDCASVGGWSAGSAGCDAD